MVHSEAPGKLRHILLYALGAPCMGASVALLLGWYATGQSDMWKNIAKVPVLSTKMNVSGQVSYTESSFTSFFNRHIPYALTTL